MSEPLFETPTVEDLPAHGLPLSPVVVHDGLVFICGQVPRDANGPKYPDVVSPVFADQAHQVMKNMAACLAAAGCGFEHVLKVNVFIQDWDDFKEFNQIYLSYFDEPLPVRTAVGANLHGFLIEVECIARQP